MKKLATLLILVSACTSSFAQAPPMVDITLADNGNNQLEVRLRPNGPFQGVVSNVVFTLRWQEQQAPAVSLMAPVFPQSEYLPFGAMPIANGGNGYMYRTYSCVGLVHMEDFGHAWEGGIEYPVCTLEVLTPGVTVEIVNDDYTASNNSSYYCSLNGIPRTGSIYPTTIPVVSAMAVNSGNGYMDVMLTPSSDYFGWVSSLDLTLRWPAGQGSLGAIAQPEAIATAIPMAKAGPEVTADGFTYQRFHGEGAMSLAVAQCGWLANEDHLLMRLPVTGGMGDATVANDAWTAANNGAYAIILNGQPATGGTDELSASTGPEFGEVIPQMQVIAEELHVLSSANGSGKLTLTVLSSAGQPVAQRRAKWGALERIPMAGWANGMYTLRVDTEAGRTARRFIKQ